MLDGRFNGRRERASQERAGRVLDGRDDHTVAPVDRVEHRSVAVFLRHAAQGVPDRLGLRRARVDTGLGVSVGHYPALVLDHCHHTILHRRASLLRRRVELLLLRNRLPSFIATDISVRPTPDASTALVRHKHLNSQPAGS